MRKWEIEELREAMRENGDTRNASKTDRELEALAQENWEGDGMTTQQAISQRGFVARALRNKNHN
jgi:rRNA maturation endonuclease Nob1